MSAKDKFNKTVHEHPSAPPIPERTPDQPSSGSAPAKKGSKPPTKSKPMTPDSCPACGMG